MYRGEKVWSTLSGCWKTYKKKIRINNHPIDLTNNSCVEKNEEFAKSRSDNQYPPLVTLGDLLMSVGAGDVSERLTRGSSFGVGTLSISWRRCFFDEDWGVLDRRFSWKWRAIHHCYYSGNHLCFFTHSTIYNFPPIGKRQALLRISSIKIQ